MGADRRRLDAELVRRGLAASRGEAVSLIESGHVLVDGAPAARPANQAARSSAVVVLGDGPAYVSRGGEKLAHALVEFGLDVTGLECLDAGSSTGGLSLIATSLAVASGSAASGGVSGSATVGGPGGPGCCANSRVRASRPVSTTRADISTSTRMMTTCTIRLTLQTGPERTMAATVCRSGILRSRSSGPTAAVSSNSPRDRCRRGRSASGVTTTARSPTS